MKIYHYLLILALLIPIILIPSYIIVHNEYIKKVENHWTMADRSSTIEDKAYHINNFVTALESLQFNDMHAAVFFKNQNNSFSYNLTALKSLQSRLNKIKTMDPNSFAYQTAIQQITEQEQGQADPMLRVFSDCYFLDKSIFLYAFELMLFLSFLLLIGFIIFWLAHH